MNSYSLCTDNGIEKTWFLFFSPLKLEDVRFLHLVSQTSVVLESHNISTAPGRLFNKSSCAGVMISVMRVTTLIWPCLWTLHKSGGLRQLGWDHLQGMTPSERESEKTCPNYRPVMSSLAVRHAWFLRDVTECAESPSAHVKDSSSWNTQSKFLIGRRHKLHDKKVIHRLWLMISIPHISYLDTDKVFPFIH